MVFKQVAHQPSIH